ADHAVGATVADPRTNPERRRDGSSEAQRRLEYDDHGRSRTAAGQDHAVRRPLLLAALLALAAPPASHAQDFPASTPPPVFPVLRPGRLTLGTRDRMQLGTGVHGELIGEVASYATFVRPGPASLLGTGTYVKIPWTPKMADPLSVMTLGLPLRGLVTPKAATW